MDTSTTPLGRRAFLGSATALATLTVVGLAAPVAAATPVSGSHGGRPLPSPPTVALPDGFRPEGIASGPGTT